MHPLNRAFKKKKSLIFPLLEVLQHEVKLLKIYTQLHSIFNKCAKHI